MKARFLPPLALGLLVLAQGPVVADDVQVSLSLSTQTASVGDPIDVRIVVKTSAVVENVTITPSAGEFVVLGQRSLPLRRLGDSRVFERIVTLAAFRTGDVAIGPFRIDLLSGGRLLQVIETAATGVNLRSLLGPQDRDIGPLKPLRSIRGDPAFFFKRLLLFMSLPLLLLLGLWLRRRWRRSRDRRQRAPILSPEEELDIRLRELISWRLTERGETKRLFILLGEICKRFLARKYGFPAEDFTTAETLSTLEAHETDNRIRHLFAELFRVADLVKFARFVPERGEVDTQLFSGRQLVDEYRRRLEVERVAPGR